MIRFKNLYKLINILTIAIGGFGKIPDNVYAMPKNVYLLSRKKKYILTRKQHTFGIHIKSVGN